MAQAWATEYVFNFYAENVVAAKLFPIS